MKLLLHICCGPCACYPVSRLRSLGYEVRGYYFNPNIHPYTEFARRLDTVQKFATAENLPVIYDVEYNVREFIRQTAFREEERCRTCYYTRLKAAAAVAQRGKFDAFTTTILYSKMQKHELVKEIAHQVAREYNIGLFYEDFREGWQAGIKRSQELDLYRQTYCGCIYSEEERYRPKKADHESDRGNSKRH